MPGICGLISKGKPAECKSVVKAMTEAMLYDPAYVSGEVSQPAIGAYVGWVCQRGTFSDCMPVWNEKKDVVLVLWGEEFSDPDVLKKLRSQNHRFDKGNASYLVHMYEENGIEFLRDLNGWFSGVLIDLPEKTVVLFNDRSGGGKLLLVESPEGLYFASEARALLRVCPETRSLEMAGVAEMWCCDNDLGQRTLFRGVTRLVGGSVLEITNCEVRQRRRYIKSGSLLEQTLLERHFYCARADECFKRILPRYLRSEGPVALELDESLGSHRLLQLMDRTSERLRCYVGPGPFAPGLDEVVAVAAQELFQISARLLCVGQEFLRGFAGYAERSVYHTDGYGSVVAALALHIAEVGKGLSPIHVAGGYASELVTREPVSGSAKVFVPEFRGRVEEARKRCRELMKMDPLERTFFTMDPDQRHALECARAHLMVRCPFLDNEMMALAFRAPCLYEKMELFAFPKADKTFSDDDWRSALKSIPQALGQKWREFRGTRPGQGCSWTGRTARRSFGQPRLDRFRVWFREGLADFVKEVLLDPRTVGRSYLDPKQTTKVVDEHLAGRNDHTVTIAKLLTLELVQRHLIQSPGG
jgi:asparagine synthase (glutamine-hydrolysing)